MAAFTLILTLCSSLCDPSPYLNCSLSHGQLRSNDALLLLCFRKSPLFIQFWRRLVPYGNRPPLPSNSHLLWRPRREANGGSAPQKAKWQSSDIFIMPDSLFVFNLQLERGTIWKSRLLPYVIASSGNGETWGGEGKLYVPQAILRMIRHCVHSCGRPLRTTIILGFNTVSLLLCLSVRTCISAFLACVTAEEQARR